MILAPDTLKLLGIALVFGLVIAMTIIDTRLRARRRRGALAQFAQWLASPQARAYGLGPDACEIVAEREPSHREAAGTYSLTLYLRNPEGTHVLFISQDRGPYVKVMTPEIAKVVLKDRFRA